jgi:hypothetical protein
MQDFDSFENSCCELLLAVNEHRNPQKCTQKEISAYCLRTKLEVLLSVQDIGTLIQPEQPVKTQLKDLG